MTLQRFNSPFPALIDDARETELEPLSQQDYVLLKAGMPDRRSLLITKCLRALGVRISELLNVTMADIRADDPFLAIAIKRGKKPETTRWEWTFVPPELAIELRDWVSGLQLRGDQPLFPGQTVTGKRLRPLTRAMYWHTFKGVADRELGRKAHPHQLRGLYVKTVALLTMQEGVAPSIAVASKMVGHVDIKTTMHHYFALTRQERQEIQRRIGEWV